MIMKKLVQAMGLLLMGTLFGGGCTERLGDIDKTHLSCLVNSLPYYDNLYLFTPDVIAKITV